MHVHHAVRCAPCVHFVLDKKRVGKRVKKRVDFKWVKKGWEKGSEAAKKK